MRPRAILKHHSNSYPFEERNLDLTGMVKVGRAIAKCKPQSDNAIFDCKVLSRNHAVIWFENGKFFIKDSCSSNGTFINNNRLSPANEDSVGKEIHSNDIIQFGVEVVDSTNKITHGCIILRIKLFYPNGSEASRTTTMFNIPTANMLPPYYSYTQMLEREQRIYQKLDEIEDVLADAQPIADMLVEAKQTQEELLRQLDELQTQCDDRKNQLDNLYKELEKQRLQYDNRLQEQEQRHQGERRGWSSSCQERDIEIGSLQKQRDRMMKQDHRLMITSLVLLLIVLVMGGFDMIVMFMRLI